MSFLEQLGVALGLASLAGLNLYLTVLLTGLAIRFNLLQVAAEYHNLEALSHPAVLAVAAVLFIMEFVADKVPWLDTLWDTVHTFIRPLGGVVLGLQALGEMPMYMQVAAALVAGGAALTTHGVKASSRLVVNHSPEPVSNISMSLTEDAAVAGGVFLTFLHPVIALAVFSVLLVLSWLIFPKLLRAARVTWKLAWQKLQMPGRKPASLEPLQLPMKVDDALRDVLLYKGGLSVKEIHATVPCLTGKSKGVRGLTPNLDGLLILTREMRHLYFTANKGLRTRLFRVPVTGLKAEVDSRFLSENLMLESHALKAVFRFPRGDDQSPETIARLINEAAALRTGEEDGEAEIMEEQRMEPAATPTPTLADAPAPELTHEAKLEAGDKEPAALPSPLSNLPEPPQQPDSKMPVSKAFSSEIRGDDNKDEVDVIEESETDFMTEKSPAKPGDEDRKISGPDQ